MTWLAASRDVWRSLVGYLGGDRRARHVVVSDATALAEFLDTRASHVGQISLYGYIRTRAGSRYPELFENDAFLVAVNIAKWQVWIACLSDLAVYAGGLIRREANVPKDEVLDLIAACVRTVLDRTGLPEEAGDRFDESRRRLYARLAATDWDTVGDDESDFAESPEALVIWAPIVDGLKALDSEIVRNSVRFRWQGVRRELRDSLKVDEVLISHRGKQV